MARLAPYSQRFYQKDGVSRWKTCLCALSHKTFTYYYYCSQSQIETIIPDMIVGVLQSELHQLQNQLLWAFLSHENLLATHRDM
jgi:hypothetical protein